MAGVRLQAGVVWFNPANMQLALRLLRGFRIRGLNPPRVYNRIFARATADSPPRVRHAAWVRASLPGAVWRICASA